MNTKLCIAMVLLAASSSGQAMEPGGAPVPTSVSALTGCWEGQGAVMGKAVAIAVNAYPIVQEPCWRWKQPAARWQILRTNMQRTWSLAVPESRLAQRRDQSSGIGRTVSAVRSRPWDAGKAGRAGSTSLTNILMMPL
jgi:hypothetical protein